MKRTLIHDFNDLKEKRRIKKNVPKGPVDVKEIRKEIKDAQKKFRRP